MAKTSISGPGSGHYIVIPVASGVTANDDITTVAPVLPPGMTVRVFGVSWHATASTGGSLQVGDGSDADAYVTTQTIVSDVPDFSEFDGVGGSTLDITDASTVEITVGGTLTGLSLSLWGYVTAHTTLLNREGL